MYCPTFTKLGHNICFYDILDEFENGSGMLKYMAARGRGIFPFMAIIKPCKHSRSHINCPTFMKLGQNICSNDMLFANSHFPFASERERVKRLEKSPVVECETVVPVEHFYIRYSCFTIKPFCEDWTI